MRYEKGLGRHVHCLEADEIDHSATSWQPAASVRGILDQMTDED